ncbi:MAG TPA: hypothetical protein PLS53_00110 [Thermoanaerobaculaceae bacterium]|nr:hypothetical protein [Thermoanaerobaculaceae bacterium]
MAITFDGINRIILLDGAITVSIRTMYSDWVRWVATADNARFAVAFSTVADPPTVPLYATLINGWLVRPIGGAYILTLNQGFLYKDGGGDPFSPVTSGAEPRIRYENPVIAVGYDVGGGGLTQQQVRDAMMLGASPGVPAATSIDGKLKKIKGDTGLIGGLF